MLQWKHRFAPLLAVLAVIAAAMGWGGESFVGWGW